MIPSQTLDRQTRPAAPSLLDRVVLAVAFAGLVLCPIGLIGLPFSRLPLALKPTYAALFAFGFLWFLRLALNAPDRDFLRALRHPSTILPLLTRLR